MNNNGFRNDGSYYYKSIIDIGGIKNETHPDYNFKNTFDRIKKGKSRFEYGQNISYYSINELNSLLEYCKKNNIYVISFLPPYASEVWNKINQEKENYAYMFKIDSSIKPIFKRYGFDFFDFSDMTQLNASKCEVIDGFHGSEKVYLRLLINIGENNEKINEFIDLDYLKKKLDNSKGCFSTETKTNFFPQTKTQNILLQKFS